MHLFMQFFRSYSGRLSFPPNSFSLPETLSPSLSLSRDFCVHKGAQKRALSLVACQALDLNHTMKQSTLKPKSEQMLRGKTDLESFDLLGVHQLS
jgi:hypothetical protein